MVNYIWSIYFVVIIYGKYIVYGKLYMVNIFCMRIMMNNYTATIVLFILHPWHREERQTQQHTQKAGESGDRESS
jgi:hypothetical protein